MRNAFLFIIFLGLILRLILVGNTGFIADISFWKSWSLAAIDHGIVWTAHNTNINYPPGFIYVLWFMGKLYTLFGDPHNFNSFWKENNFGFLLASKSVAIISDVAIACLIYWFFSQKEKLKQLGAVISNRVLQLRSGQAIEQSNNKSLNSHNPQPTTHNLPLILSSVFFLNPVVIIDSALWGQVESFGILFTLIAIILLFYKKPLLATAIFTVGALMKLQNIIYIPIYFLFIWRYFDLKTVIKSLGAAAAAFFAVTLPFVIAKDMNQVLYLLTVNGDYFPWLSLNAHNLWWIVAKGAGMQVSDKITVLGILNAKTEGLLLFSSFYLLSCILIYIKPTPRNLFLSLTAGIFAFFLFTTQSHERYSYPVIVFMLFLYPFLKNIGSNPKHEARNSKQIQMAKIQNIKSFKDLGLGMISNFDIRISDLYFWLLYGLLTLSIFYNVHMGLILNYPKNGLPIISLLSSKSLGILNSYFLILLFFLLLPFIFSQISYLFLVLSSIFLVLGLLGMNFSYLFKGEVSVTSFKPVLTKQDFASPQFNRSVNSYSGWKSWNRLSNNYFYYRKGIGSHANSNLVFDIDKKFSTLTTDYGIDTEAATPATVVFKIFGDGKELFSSKKMGRFDFPGHISVSVAGVKHLGLVMEDAGDGINSDHADWLNPVLYK